MRSYQITACRELNAKLRILFALTESKLCGKEERRRGLSSFMAGDYENAITALNSLQTNAAVIEKSAKEKSANAHKNPSICLRNLQIIGVQKEDLNKLNVIHVSGTKGKGSTCALVESMLRCHGYKTGLYTSPHLVEVRERIRINGLPISREMFSSYFWNVYNTLKNNEVTANDMPAYFAFLTVLAFKTFIEEKVDVAVIEVGVGGAFDQTNVVPKPVAVGVTSLGFDHTNLLGNTIDSIATNKAGIFREAVSAFTIPQTYSEGLQTLLNKAQEIKCPLYLCPPLTSYSTSDSSAIQIGIEGDAQTMNTSLALQLCNHWMTVTNNRNTSQINVNDGRILPAQPFKVSDQQLEGIKKCKWPGRCQIMFRNKITYFMDGAHTSESIEHCVSWFQRESNKLSKNKNIQKVMLFNSTGDRDLNLLIKPLTSINFDAVIFTTNTPSHNPTKNSDLIDYNTDTQRRLEKVSQNREVWQKMANKKDNIPSGDFTCIEDALHWIEKFNKSEVHLLVTGSLRLVGGVLSIIDPQLEESLC